jgi:hypothetical protein
MSEYEASNAEVNPPPSRDEILIEMSVLLGEINQGRFEVFNERGTKLVQVQGVRKETLDKAIAILKRAVAFVRASS